MRLFLSYQTQDGAMAQRLRTAMMRRRPALEIYIDREGLFVGDVWQQRLADELAAADGVLLLLGRKLGPWQEREFQEAQRLQLLAGRERRPRIIPIALMPDAPLPAFAALYHHVTAPEPDAEETLDRILAALDRTDPAEPKADWQRINPYKGLAALTAADAAFFFGREQETAATLQNIRERPGKVLTLVGNSGVGKSSLIQAGVIDALRTQRWPGTRKHDPEQWIGALTDSHRWPAIIFRPGETPVLALAFAFLSLVLEPSAALEKEATEWTGLLLAGTPLDRLRAHVSDLLATRTGEPPPKRFLVYVDQGEELYARSTNEQRARFSAIIAEAARRPEFQILTSLRSDYYGRLQDDLALFKASERLDLPPMSAAELTRAMVEPARRLGVRFEPADAPAQLANLAAPQSGALPLLSDLMAELWREMEQRGDGILSWSKRADLVDVGRPLSARADRYLAEQPGDKEAARALFTLRLAHVPILGEPVRRRALKSECTEEQWRIVETLSDHDWRLLTVSEDVASHEPTVEVAHEQLLRSWTTLRDWLNESRRFLTWKGTLEQARLDWLAADRADNALLMGAHLTRAQYWRNERGSDLTPDDRSFIEASKDREAHVAQKERSAAQARQRLVALSVLVIVGLIGVINREYIATQLNWVWTTRPYRVANVDPYVLKPEAERALKPGDSFKECAQSAACPSMVVLPKGTFMMGPPGDQHEVVIDKLFAVSKFELSFADWDACVSVGSCPRDGRAIDYWGRGEQPLIYVNWQDAKAYVGWLSEMTGKTYRLLTEAEWEYAARAGTQTAYSWGDDVGEDNTNCRGCGDFWKKKPPVKVDSYTANKFGLHNMHGNVWEWVEDCYHEKYDSTVPKNGSEWKGGDCNRRVVRGGSWDSEDSKFLRSDYRAGITLDARSTGLGIRVARTLETE